MSDAAAGLNVDDLAPEPRSVWAQVEALWSLAMRRDAEAVRAALHPDYAGWEMSAPSPHEREFAVRSVAGDSPPIVRYALMPLSVKVYEGTTGVAHYAYSAVVAPLGRPQQHVDGRWTEVYVKRDGTWLLIAVNGGVQGNGATV